MASVRAACLGILMLLCSFSVREIVSQRSGDLRLNYNGFSGLSKGRLEMYYSYRWIPFCITGFNILDADLICNQLGYLYASRYASVEALGYFRASTSIAISSVRCSGSTRFSSCLYSTSVCSNYQHVGLICTNTRSSLRLVSSGGYSYGISSGRLQIFVNNAWGTVCDDDFGNIEAAVACRQLGYSSYITYASASTNLWYSSTLPNTRIWLDNLNCKSTSTDLRLCTNAVGVHNCQHSEDVILSCSLAPNPTSGALRLYSYSSSSSGEGRLELYYNSRWTPFCITGFDMHEADLACKKLGYLYASRYATVGTLGYGQGSGTSSISSFSCPDSVSTSCYYSTTSSCSHYRDVGIRCTRSGSFLRLVSSEGYSSGVPSGRLQIFVNNTWGTVCDDHFGSTEAQVACHQLGFLSYSTYSIASDTSGYSSTLPYTPIWLDSLNCYSTSTDLRLCSNTVGAHDCSHSEDIILTCSTGGQLRNADTTSPSSRNRVGVIAGGELRNADTTSPSSRNRVGVIAGSSVGVVALCLIFATVGIIITALVAVSWRKRRANSSPTITAQQQHEAYETGTYSMSDLETQDKKFDFQ